MQFYSADQVARALPYGVLVEVLHDAFRRGSTVPLRSIHTIELTGGRSGLFALMPAWQSGGGLAVKMVTVFPEPSGRAPARIQAAIVLFDGETGSPLAVVDGTEVTRRRTAAASALAAKFLARDDAHRLLVVGTGAQAPHNALAFSSVRPIQTISIWGRSAAKAKRLADRLSAQNPGLSVRPVDDLEQAVRNADIVSCVTSAGVPLVSGAWLRPGMHLDLVGAHTSTTRECDDECVRRARVYVDTISGAMAEAGDILIPIEHGAIRESDIVGDLHGLCRGEIAGRHAPEEVTLFKAVGTALEDLAAAQLVATRGGV